MMDFFPSLGFQRQLWTALNVLMEKRMHARVAHSGQDCTKPSRDAITASRVSELPHSPF